MDTFSFRVAFLIVLFGNLLFVAASTDEKRKDITPNKACHPLPSLHPLPRNTVNLTLSSLLGGEGNETFVKQQLQRTLAATQPIKPRKFVSYFNKEFIRFSAYRYGHSSFFIISLVVTKLFELHAGMFEGCIWTSGARGNSDIKTVLIGHAMPDRTHQHHGKRYCHVTIECLFRHNMSEERSGQLFLVLSPPSGGEGARQAVLVHEESEVDAETAVHTYDYVHCGSPFYGKEYPDQISQWLLFHRQLLGDRTLFLLYDSGALSPSLRKALTPLSASLAVQVIDFRDQLLYPGWSQNQNTALNDCLHWARPTARWIFNIDYDEYLTFKPPATVQTILQPQTLNATAVSFADVLYSVRRCIPPANDSLADDRWLVEKMSYRNRDPVCARTSMGGKYRCQAAFGRRKWFVNPKFTAMVSIHHVEYRGSLVPGCNYTVVLHSDVAWFGHFRRIGSRPIASFCRGPDAGKDNDMELDSVLSLQAKSLRERTMVLG